MDVRPVGHNIISIDDEHNKELETNWQTKIVFVPMNKSLVVSLHHKYWEHD
jgi:hypothetical protein